jgi:hypothetical protein
VKPRFRANMIVRIASGDKGTKLFKGRHRLKHVVVGVV